MYQPKKYRKENPQFIFNFIKQHPFTTLVIKGDNLLATHTPVLAEGTAENFRLFGHVAKDNPLFQFLKEGTDVLLIFHGAQAYISSSWYTKKGISTWDYSAVHVNASFKRQSSQELETSLEKMVSFFEKDQEYPLWYQDIPRTMLQEHLPLIEGFWLEPVKTEAIAKLHQGHSQADLQRIIHQLDKQKTEGSSALSRDLRKENDL